MDWIYGCSGEKVLIDIMGNDILPASLVRDLLTSKLPDHVFQVMRRRSLDVVLNSFLFTIQVLKKIDTWDYYVLILPVLSGEEGSSIYRYPRIGHETLLNALTEKGMCKQPLLVNEHILILQKEDIPPLFGKMDYLELPVDYLKRTFLTLESCTISTDNYNKLSQPVCYNKQDWELFQNQVFYAIIPSYDGIVATDFFLSLAELPQPSTFYDFICGRPHDQGYTLGAHHAVDMKNKFIKESGNPFITHAIFLDDDSSYWDHDLLKYLLLSNEEIIGGSTFSRKMNWKRKNPFHVASYARIKITDDNIISNQLEYEEIIKNWAEKKKSLNAQTGLCSMLIKINVLEELLEKYPTNLSYYEFGKTTSNNGQYQIGADQSMYDHCKAAGKEPKFCPGAFHGHIMYLDLNELYAAWPRMDAEKEVTLELEEFRAHIGEMKQLVDAAVKRASIEKNQYIGKVNKP